jgi:hypothetical protein
MKALSLSASYKVQSLVDGIKAIIPMSYILLALPPSVRLSTPQPQGFVFGSGLCIRQSKQDGRPACWMLRLSSFFPREEEIRTLLQMYEV